MISSATIASKIKYDFLELTENLFELCQDNKIEFTNGLIFYPKFILGFKYGYDGPIFFNIFCYFVQSSTDSIKFRARYIRPEERHNIQSNISSYTFDRYLTVYSNLMANQNEQYRNKKYYAYINQLAQSSLLNDIKDANLYKKGLINTIYQYYNIEDFKIDFHFYLKYYNKSLINSIEDGSWFLNNK